METVRLALPAALRKAANLGEGSDFSQAAARLLARGEGLPVRGSAGLREAFYIRGQLADLRAVFRQLLVHRYD